MKRSEKKSKGVIKGTYRAFFISVLLHVAAFILAGSLVVFTILKKEEQVFDPPQTVERPKMKLKKPQVKIKKSKPKQTNRIVTKSKSSTMPRIELPEMSGIGDDLDSGIDGFDNMPDLAKITLLGSSESIGNDLVGTLYDLKFTRTGRWNPLPEEEWRYVFHKFFREGWDTKLLSKYYRSPKKLYATYLVLPPTISAMAPVAFGMSDKMASGGEWILHYKGKLVHKEGITFRFWVAIDDSLAIRVDNEVVIAASFINSKDGSSERAPLMYQGLWLSSSPDTGKYLIGQSLATVGDWITLEPGVAKDIEIIITDNVAANAHYMVLVEEEGVEYPRGRHNGPLLPIFKTEPLTHDQLDLIYRGMAADEIDCTNGPVFRDY